MFEKGQYMPADNELDKRFAEIAKTIRTETPDERDRRLVITINRVLQELRQAIEGNSAYVFPNPNAVKKYAEEFMYYLGEQFTAEGLDYTIFLRFETLQSQESHKSKGTESIIIGNNPGLKCQVWVEIDKKNNDVYVCWKKVTLK